MSEFGKTLKETTHKYLDEITEKTNHETHFQVIADYMGAMMDKVSDDFSRKEKDMNEKMDFMDDIEKMEDVLQRAVMLEKERSDLKTETTSIIYALGFALNAIALQKLRDDARA